MAKALTVPMLYPPEGRRLSPMIRSTTSEYQPSPPINRIPAKGGKIYTGIVFRDGTATNPGVKPNMCVAPPPGETRLPKIGNRL
jgi:hypothetical protein